MMFWFLLGDDEKLILCDECNKAFHLFCLRPALYRIPVGEWLCPACQPTVARRGSRSRYLQHRCPPFVSMNCCTASHLTPHCCGIRSTHVRVVYNLPLHCRNYKQDTDEEEDEEESEEEDSEEDEEDEEENDYKAMGHSCEYQRDKIKSRTPFSVCHASRLRDEE